MRPRIDLTDDEVDDIAQAMYESGVTTDIGVARLLVRQTPKKKDQR